MKVSVIIFIDDKNIDISKCIDSVLNQTLDDIEIVIISDSNNIENINIIEKYQRNNSNIKLINLDIDNYNEYLTIVQGEYIYFLNNYNNITDDMIQKLYEESIKNDLDMACFSYNNFSKSDECLKYMGVLNGLDVYMKLSSRGYDVHDISLNFYKTEFLKNSIIYGEDVRNIKNTHNTMILAKKAKYLCNSIVSMSNYKYENDIYSYLNDEIYSLIYLIQEYNNVDINKFSGLKHTLDNIINKKIEMILEVSYRNLLFDNISKIEKVIKKYNYTVNTKSNIGVSSPVLYTNILMNNNIGISKEDEIKLYGNKKKIYYMLLPEHGNVGDQAIAYATLKFLEDNYPEYKIIKLNYDETIDGVNLIKSNFNKGDFIVLHGGGNMGNLYLHEEKARRYIIAALSDYPMISFPQTIYFTDDYDGNNELQLSREYYNYNKNLILLGRENRSYNIMSENFKSSKVYFCPDIVFYLNNKLKIEEKNRNQIMTCFRKDKESYYDVDLKNSLIESLGRTYSVFENDTTVTHGVSHLDREKELKILWNEYAKSKVVITDRLHGMIFAVITKTPCIVLRSLDYKVLESYELIKDLNYIRLIDTLDLDYIKEIIEEMANLREFDNISDEIFNFDSLKNYIDLNLL